MCKKAIILIATIAILVLLPQKFVFAGSGPNVKYIKVFSCQNLPDDKGIVIKQHEKSKNVTLKNYTQMYGRTKKMTMHYGCIVDKDTAIQPGDEDKPTKMFAKEWTIGEILPKITASVKINSIPDEDGTFGYQLVILVQHFRGLNQVMALMGSQYYDTELLNEHFDNPKYQPKKYSKVIVGAGLEPGFEYVFMVQAVDGKTGSAEIKNIQIEVPIIGEQ